ncbi:class I SAM-dependent methyltransferase [Solirubrobacter ginsenosidimutans]|uniref:Class I SAM-dependent methyltransferase n=1 Tax=Solirubrobacter ginsenosidimutans TaxID=490573 RepID=A0A9X3MXQ9_9ACTN|nr:class I SAM-dependent methyltransferase [Solirubrobacter ginsenosidimutans]MDA0164754.1 class I SAM-dependent methyltransferase [Solirubrobacter ginsenosidimutans]
MNVSVVGAGRLGQLRATAIPADGWQELTACPICGEAEHVFDVARIDPGGPITAACAACEHGFLRRRPTESWVAGYYASEWDAAGRALTDRRPVTVKPDPKMAKLAGDRLPAGAAVLDVGAGFGQQLLGFQQAGLAPHGLEASEHRAAYVRETLGIPCSTVPVEEAEAPDDLRLVVSHHVLEHVADPHSFIAAQVRLLGDDGLVAVAVPSLWHELPPQAFHYVGHLSLFTPRSLTLLLAAHGLRVVSLTETFELLVVAERGDPALQAPADPAFAERVSAWARRPFGDSGRHTIAWRKSRRPAHMYDDEVVSTGRARLLELGTRGALKRVGDPSLRLLPVDVRETDGLPVVVGHETYGQAWIK